MFPLTPNILWTIIVCDHNINGPRETIKTHNHHIKINYIILQWVNDQKLRVPYPEI